MFVLVFDLFICVFVAVVVVLVVLKWAFPDWPLLS
jgi:hypothetical protein